MILVLMLNQGPVRGFVRVVLALYNGTDAFLEKGKNQRTQQSVSSKGLCSYCKGAANIPSMGFIFSQ